MRYGHSTLVYIHRPGLDTSTPSFESSWPSLYCVISFIHDRSMYGVDPTMNSTMKQLGMFYSYLLIFGQSPLLVAWYTSCSIWTFCLCYYLLMSISCMFLGAWMTTRNSSARTHTRLTWSLWNRVTSILQYNCLSYFVTMFRFFLSFSGRTTKVPWRFFG